MDEFFKKSAGIGILLIGLSVVYYFVIYLPWQAKESKAALDACLQTAQTNYDYYWASSCKKDGEKDPNCSLPTDDADTVNNSLKQDQNNCFREYPQH